MLFPKLRFLECNCNPVSRTKSPHFPRLFQWAQREWIISKLTCVASFYSSGKWWRTWKYFASTRVARAAKRPSFSDLIQIPASGACFMNHTVPPPSVNCKSNSWFCTYIEMFYLSMHCPYTILNVVVPSSTTPSGNLFYIPTTLWKHCLSEYNQIFHLSP